MPHTQAAQRRTPSELIAELYSDARPHASSYQWEWKHDRWIELMACALIAVGAAPHHARSMAATLAELSLDDPDALSDSDSDTAKLAKNVLARLVEGQASVEASFKALSETSRCFAPWSNSHVNFLRSFGETMRTALSGELTKQGMASNQADLTATLWLQNVAHMPILAAGRSVLKNDLAKHGVDADGLTAAADEAGLHVPVLDELLMLQREPEPA